MTDDTSQVDKVVARVEALKEPLTSITYNAFDRRYAESWQSLMDAFNADVASIEEQSIHFIDDAFQKLRSAEGAFELVENFQNVQSRDVRSRRPMSVPSTRVHQTRSGVVSLSSLRPFGPNRDAPRWLGKSR